MPHVLPRQFFDSNGDPLSGGSVEFYLGSTSTASNLAYPTYDDAVNGTNTLGTSLTLDSGGFGQIWFTDIAMKYLTKSSTGAQVGPTIDDLYGAGSGESITIGTGSTISFNLPDNNAAAADFLEGANSYLKFITTDGSEHLQLSKGMFMPDDVQLKFGNGNSAPDGIIEMDTAPATDIFTIKSSLSTELLLHAAADMTVSTSSGSITFKPNSQTTLTIANSAITCAAELITEAAGLGGARFNLPHGTTPTSYSDGDMWTTTAGLYVRINGATVGPLS